MAKEYPVNRLSSAPGTGRLFYEFLLDKIKIPASANHNIWYLGVEGQLANPEQFAFRGDIPSGKTLELVALEGNKFPEQLPAHIVKICEGIYAYTFQGRENAVLVGDLAESAKEELKIPSNSRPREKVFNSNFRKFEDLPELTKMSNELSALSVAKSISSYHGGVLQRVNYSERDVSDFLTASLSNLGGREMSHILHGSHLAWASLAYIRDKGKVAGNIRDEFYGQNTSDFYLKDVGSVLPTIFFSLANLGKDPVEAFNLIDTEIWGAKEAANYMLGYMKK